MTDEAAAKEGRDKAIGYYRVLAGVQLLVALGLIVSASLAASFTGGRESFGPPYFVGGFIVGIPIFIGCLLSFRIQQKGPNINDSDIVKREVGCAISGSYILATFTFMGCFISFFFVGTSGFCDGGDTCNYSEETVEANKSLAIALLALLSAAILTIIFSLYISCTFSSYFGVKINRRRRGQMMVVNLTQPEPAPAQGTGSTSNDALVQQMAQQNMLLQQQLALQQQQLQQQQQQQQQQNTSFGYPPPPPPSYDAANNPAYPPNMGPVYPPKYS